MKCTKCGTENSDSVKFCPECAAPLSTPIETVIEEMANNDIQLEELKTALKDKYEIIREIGRGGMGIVYECKELSLDRTIALKVLPRELSYDKKFVERFKNEIKILAKIEHPNIVPLISADETGGFIYFTMKYVKGRTLAEIIMDKGELDPKETMRIALQIAQGLSCAHGQNVVHRDLKPENIMLDNNNHIYVMDFGIARALEGTRMTRTGSAIGTPEYMSPEQCSGESEPDGRSDIYSLGVMMYEMLTGIVPFKGESTSVMYQHVHAEPVSLIKLAKNAPIGIINIVNSCLEKKPEKRPQSAADLMALLKDVIEIRKNNKRLLFSRKDKMISKPYGRSPVKKTILRIFKIALAIIVLCILHGALWSFYFMIDFVPDVYLKFVDSAHFADYYYNSCTEKIDKENYQGAIADCTKAIELGYEGHSVYENGKQKQENEVYVNLAGAKFRKEDYEGAINDLTNAIKIDPNNGRLYSYRGHVKGVKGDVEGFSIDFQLALKLNPKDPSIYRQRGLTKLINGDYDIAIADFTSAIDMGKGDQPILQIIYKDRAKAKYQKSDLSGALDDYSKAIDIDNKDAEASFYRGVTKHDMNDMAGAKSDYTRAIDIDPKYKNEYVKIGDGKIKMNNYIGAISDYTRAIEINPYNANAYFKRGEAKKMKGDSVGAHQDFEKSKSIK